MGWARYEEIDAPTYECFSNLAYFLEEFQAKVTESQQLSAFDFVLKATPARWCGTHKQYIFEWSQCRILLEIRFGEEISYIGRNYIVLTSPVEHIEHCRMT